MEEQLLQEIAQAERAALEAQLQLAFLRGKLAMLRELRAPQTRTGSEEKEHPDGV